MGQGKLDARRGTAMLGDLLGLPCLLRRRSGYLRRAGWGGTLGGAGAAPFARSSRHRLRGRVGRNTEVAPNLSLMSSEPCATDVLPTPGRARGVASAMGRASPAFSGVGHWIVGWSARALGWVRQAELAARLRRMLSCSAGRGVEAAAPPIATCATRSMRGRSMRARVRASLKRHRRLAVATLAPSQRLSRIVRSGAGPGPGSTASSA